MTDFDDVIDEIILYLYRKDFNDDNKNFMKLKIMWILFKVCQNEAKLDETMQTLDKIEERKRLR